MYYRPLLLALIITAVFLSNAGCNFPAQEGSLEITPSVLEVTPVDPLTEVVIAADLIVSGTITDKRYEVVTVGQGDRTGKYAYTIFTLSVEKVVKGDSATKEVFIKAPGGMIGDVFQVPLGAYFAIADKALVCLSSENDDVYQVLHNGIPWFESSLSRVMPPMGLQEAIGRIIVIMKANNIPIALPLAEWPPLPVQVLPEGGSIGLNKDSNIYVCNSSNGIISVYNLGSFKRISQISVGRDARIVASSDKPNLCAISLDAHTLSIINMETNSVEKQITLQDAPGDVAYIPGSGDICVTLPALKQIQILKATLFNVEKTFILEDFPDRLCPSPDGRLVYVTVGSEQDGATELLLAIDLTSGIRHGAIELVKDRHELAMPKRGNKIYVSNQSSCSISQINLRSFQIENTFTNITKRQFPDASIGAIIISPDSRFLYFSDSQSDYIRAIALRTGVVEKEISIEHGTWSIYISNSGKYILSAARGGIGGAIQPGSVTIIDITSWKVICRIWVENGAFEVVGNKSL